jgi:hypothetical protein
MNGGLRFSAATFALSLTVFTHTLIAPAVDAQPGARSLRLVETMRIDGAKEDLASANIGFTVNAVGRISVFDSQNARFVFFDSTGRRVGTFGTKGEGPGEFAPTVGTSYALLAGELADTVWVYSLRQRRFTLIAPDFTLVRTFTLPQYDARSIVAFSPMSLRPNGEIIGRATFGQRGPVSLPDGRTVQSTRATDSALVVLNVDGTVVRRLGSAPPDSGMAVINEPGQQYRFAPVPFRRPPLVSSSPSGDRIATVVLVGGRAGTPQYRVTVVRAIGDTAYSNAYPYTPIPVTKAMADSASARMESIYGRAPGPGVSELLKLARERTPPHLPPIESLSVGADGTVWLRPHAAPGALDEWIVLAPNGETVGTVRFPRAGVSFRAATRSTLWATERDEDGFTSIVRFRIESQ